VNTFPETSFIYDQAISTNTHTRARTHTHNRETRNIAKIILKKEKKSSCVFTIHTVV